MSDDKLSIESITIKFKDRKIELSLEEVKTLQRLLNENFPDYQYPYVPYCPTWEGIYVSWKNDMGVVVA